MGLKARGPRASLLCVPLPCEEALLLVLLLFFAGCIIHSSPGSIRADAAIEPQILELLGCHQPPGQWSARELQRRRAILWDKLASREAELATPHLVIRQFRYFLDSSRHCELFPPDICRAKRTT